MKRKHLLILIFCGLSMSAILVVLYASSTLNKKIYRGSFERTFTLEPTQKTVLDLRYNSFYLAGTTQNKIYLGNPTTPFLVFFTDTSLTNLERKKLQVVGMDSVIAPERFRLTISTPYFYMANGVMGEILKGNIDDWKAVRFMPDSSYYFAEAVPLSHSAFALRSYNSYNNEYELARKTSYSPYFMFKDDILEKQIDGVFCVDGKLNYSKELRRLVYLYYYRNEFVVADTNFNIEYRGHTIDTFSIARIKVVNIESKHQRILGAPPTQINGTSCVYREKMFVQSNVMAKNEFEKEFKTKTIVDVYDLENGIYLNSFYLDNYKKKRPFDFQVFNNCKNIAALYDHYLVLYDVK